MLWQQEQIWKQLKQLRDAGAPCVLITIAALRGSVPGQLGAKAIVTKEGLCAGTIGGGKVEAKAINCACELLKTTEPGTALVTWNLQKDVGMTCGGEMTFLFEKLDPSPAWHIVLFGAGHVSQALAPLLCTLSCKLDLVDPRADWLAQIPPAQNCTIHQPANYEDRVDLVTKNSFVLCITQGHATDFPILLKAFERHPRLPFIGAIGSASKRAVLLRDLRKGGLPDQIANRLICPLGLQIGDNTPAQIAISIAAQLIKYRSSVEPNSAD